MNPDLSNQLAELKSSVVQAGTRFIDVSISELYDTRNQHPNITQLAWITLSPTINNGVIYNPMAVILLFKN